MGNVLLDLTPYCDGCEYLRLDYGEGCADDELVCGKANCFCCGLSFQRWFAEQVEKHFGNTSELSAVTIVLPQLLYPADGLVKIDLHNCTRLMTDIIKRAGLGDQLWLGALDFSLNECLKSLEQPLWSIHAMLITPALTRNQKRSLRERVSSTQDVKKPIHVMSVFDLEGAADYCAKPNFTRRVSSEVPGRKTLKFPLNGTPWQTLNSTLSKWNHSDRIVAVGLRRHGNLMRVIK